MTEIKDILDGVLPETGFQALNTYASSTQQDAKQIWRLVNRSVAVLMNYKWADLVKQAEITLEEGKEAYDLPTDYQGLIKDTMRADQRFVPVDVDTRPDFWSEIKAVGGNAGFRYRTRFYAGQLHVHQPLDGDVLRFEYWSDCPITDLNGTPQRRFEGDTDLWLLDDDLLAMDLLWRFRRMKGLDYVTDRQDFMVYQHRLQARERPAKRLNLYGGQGVPGEPHTDTWK